MTRAIIIDDEAAARGMLREMLSEQNGIEVIDEAKNGLEAIEKINKYHPDLIFLDIQMPVLSGFDILPYLKERPLIIFCTAYDQYALKAFEESAVDYLLKPVEEERLKKCLSKLHDHWQKLEKFISSDSAREGIEKIVCQTNDAHHVLWLPDIAMFRKEGRYTGVITTNNSFYLSDLTVEYLDKNISDPRFFRISRKVIIAKPVIASFKTLSSGIGELTTVEGENYSVSRSRVSKFREWLSG